MAEVTKMSDAADMLDYTVNQSWLKNIQDADFILEEDFGADYVVKLSDIRTVLTEVKEFHEYLREDHNAQAFRGWQILKQKVRDMKGGKP